MIRIIRCPLLHRGVVVHLKPLPSSNNLLCASRCISTTPLRNAVPIPTETLNAAENVQNLTQNAANLTETLAEIGGIVVDPPFVEIGLAAGYWPWHFIQSGLETFYIATGCPWWLTIIMGTMSLRLLTFPIFVHTRKFGIKSSQLMPLQQKMMERTKKYEASSDPVQRAMGRQKMKKFFKEHGTGPFTTLFNTLPMPLIFMSSITAIRQMAAVPVPSLEATSLLWMESLVTGDPYRVLPLITGCVIGLSIHSSMKSGMMPGISSSTVKKMKLVPLLPVVLMPALMGHLPCVITLYILNNAIFTQAFTLLLQNETIQKKLKFPVMIKKSWLKRNPTKKDSPLP
uniref:Membrane insertase YidC/Oxa/ALB C-terminal domain-containing protein n=1 Tax=Ciona savignyi TaxID=51511 RepID=H2Y4N8_CIOSA